MNRLRRRLSGAREAGYIAVVTVILCPILFGISAFTVDVGNWYAHVQKIQRAADAAALAGVTYMPGNFAQARQTALHVAAENGYTDNVDPEPVTGQPSKLQVTITETVDNTFGQLLGMNTETITRTAVANYQAPLPMGSPCNEYGDGPEPTAGALNPRSSNCPQDSQFWANVGSPQATKISGDAYQDGVCQSGVDGCSSGNTDYSQSGYFYSVKLSAPVSNLTIQAFDAAFVSVGDLCTANFGSGATGSVNAKNQYNYDPGTSNATGKYLQDSKLYAGGQNGSYCTGDMLINGTTPPDTTYTIREPVATSNPWDPTSYPVVSSCVKTYKGFSGDLYGALNEYKQDSSNKVTYTGGKPDVASGYNPTVASEFRQWSTLCTFPGTVSAGTYFIQVQTNAADDNSAGSGHNRFALRAFGASSADDANIAISGYTDMAMYANVTGAQTSFYLTQVGPAAAGQVLNVSLFDIGDSNQAGTVTIKPPADSNLSSFTGCIGSGPTSGNLSGCSIPANSSYNGRWEQISIPIPTGYTCDTTAVTGCWITLFYNYGTTSQPSDTTSWTANLEGTPVRLTQ